MSGIRGFKCQGLGHIAVDCPDRKVITSAQWEAVMEEKKYVEPEEELDGESKERKLSLAPCVSLKSCLFILNLADLSGVQENFKI